MGQTDETAPRPRQYRRGPGFHLENTVTSALTRWGMIPHTYLLTTIGRKSGRPHSNPVTIVMHNNKRWMVAPFGVVPWVLNARDSGVVTLTRRGTGRIFTVREVPAAEAAPVLKRYLAITTTPRPYFRATVTSPVDAFAAEADLHPVFELVPAEPAPR